MSILKATTNSEIISYFLNVNPELQTEIDLPVQGESSIEIGRNIVDNARYKNKFINTVNLIGLTIIKENRWDNPWDIFTNKGRLRFGQQIREIILDLAKVHDFNENYADKDKFLDTEVPDVYQFIHQINFQKWYEQTINENELRMAFDNEENGLYKFIENTVANLYESYKYDKYLVDKYQLCRRIVDGTITPYKISDYATKTPRQVLSDMKGVSNLMTFKSPNYNPAGVRRATPLRDQYLLIDATREGINSTEIYATSYFLNEAQAKTNMAMIDKFNEFDDLRLAELLGSSYTPFTDAEKTELAKVIGVAFANDLFMDYYYALDDTPEGKTQREFANPVTLDRNIFLHTWQVISTSPFAQACVFVNDDIAVSSVSLSPSTGTVNKGQSIQFTPTVATTGFANKSVQYTLNSQAVTSGAKISASGLLQVPSSYVDASGTQGVYTFTISTALATGDKVNINGTEVTIDATTDDTPTKQINSIYTALGTMDEYTLSKSTGTLTFTEKSGYYGTGKPTIVVTKGAGSTGVTAEATTTEGKQASTPIVVTATSIYDNTKSAQARITVS